MIRVNSLGKVTRAEKACLNRIAVKNVSPIRKRFLLDRSDLDDDRYSVFSVSGLGRRWFLGQFQKEGLKSI